MAFRTTIQKWVQVFSQYESVIFNVRHFSCSHRQHANNYKLVVIGGGSGGCATAAKFCRELGKGSVAVIEPKEIHSYQPIWTLVGAGLKTMKESQKPMADTLPRDCDWLKDSVAQFDPDNNTVTTASGKKISYEYLVVAAGIQLNYDKVKGLVEALEKDPRVCSNYYPTYCLKTFPALKAMTAGRAIFTFPNTPIKCAGAPQKIMYLADEIFRNDGKRDKIEILYNISPAVIFGVKKYAAALSDIVKQRDLHVNFRHNLIEVRHEKKEAVFQLLDSEKGETKTFQYDFLHAVPPQSAPDVVRNSKLVNADGWVDVDKQTLQHNRYPNIFGIGDCSSLPTSKTAAAAATQCGILVDNLSALMKGQKLPRTYDGYTSCPLITKSNKCILAEFDYDGNPLETFPVDQGKERWSMYQMKAEVMPRIYWVAMMNGFWKGPRIARKILHLGTGR